ncbi:UNVERIFIED_CONTAM: hypothetical protein Slati_2779600 [Sesamum latifolium]|uniref:DUF4283 domain-containing protein n=1 Tax=Sesamum latifolium TaxID=2727402 RepID=A0AAW2VZF9_9LAMI
MEETPAGAALNPNLGLPAPQHTSLGSTLDASMPLMAGLSLAHHLIVAETPLSSTASHLVAAPDSPLIREGNPTPPRVSGVHVLTPTGVGSSSAQKVSVSIGNALGTLPRPPHDCTWVRSHYMQADPRSSRKNDLQQLLIILPDGLCGIFHRSGKTGKIIVRPTIDMIHEGSKKWTTTTVGYFLGRKPPFHQVSSFARSMWSSVKDVIATVNGFYFIQFKTCEAMEEVPIWVKFCHLPVELWTNDGLSTVVSCIGRPLYPDAITKACTRLDFARVCVMIDYNATLPKHLIVLAPGDDGHELPYGVEIEYEWVPQHCTIYQSLGHKTAQCPTTKKPDKPPVAMYVQKSMNANSPAHVRGEVATDPQVDNSRKEVPRVAPTCTRPEDTGKGKELVVYNPFNALTSPTDDNMMEWGPKSNSLEGCVP